MGSDVIAKVGHYIGLGLNHHFRRNISYLQLSSCCIFRTCIEYAEEDQSGVRSMLIREKRPILSHPLLLPLGFRGIIKSAKRIFPAKVQLFLSVRING